MRDKCTTYRLLIFTPIFIFMLLVGCIQNQNKKTTITEEAKSKFAFVFNSSRNPDANSFILYGHYPLDQRVYLLNTSKTYFCEAITKEQRSFDDETVSFPITTLDQATDCGSPTEYAVAFFNAISEYRIVDLQSISNASRISTLDMLVRRSSAPNEIRTKAQDLIPGDEEFPLDELSARAYRFDVANAQGYIVSYEKGADYAYGPRFIVFDRTVHALTGWCSYPHVRAFILNGILYIESGSGCCGCGITIMELYKIEQDRVTLIYADASESD